jgi:hypothetical protein
MEAANHVGRAALPRRRQEKQTPAAQQVTRHTQPCHVYGYMWQSRDKNEELGPRRPVALRRAPLRTFKKKIYEPPPFLTFQALPCFLQEKMDRFFANPTESPYTHVKSEREYINSLSSRLPHCDG